MRINLNFGISYFSCSRSKYEIKVLSS